MDGNTEGHKDRRAVVLIPGLRREERFARLEALAGNLELAESHPLERAEPIHLAGESGIRMRPADGGAEIDLFEAYWGDMIPEDSAETPVRKLLRRFDLLVYWLMNRKTWKSFFTVSVYISSGLMVGGLLLVLWYASLLLMAADSIGNDTTLLDAVNGIPLAGALLEDVLELARTAGSWRYWAVIAFLLGVLRAESLVQMARFTKCYLQNLPGAAETGLRDRLRGRARSTLRNVLNEPYERVCVVAHSFGTILATDLLADWPAADLDRITLVTLGSPVAVLRMQSDWLDADRAKLLARTGHLEWHDFYSEKDWLCAAYTGHADQCGGGRSHRIAMDSPFWHQLNGTTHMAYYRHPAVLEFLARPQ